MGSLPEKCVGGGEGWRENENLASVVLAGLHVCQAHLATLILKER